MTKLIIDRVKTGSRKGDYVWKMVGANSEFICGSRPETFNNLADLWGNIDLVSRIKEATVIDRTADAPVVTVEG